jgi:hypothetical protein
MKIINEWTDPADDRIAKVIAGLIKQDNYQSIKLENYVVVKFDEMREVGDYIFYDFQIFQFKNYLNSISLRYQKKYIDYEVSK